MLKSTIYTKLSDIPGLRESWDSILAEDPTSTVFNSFAWIDSWIHCYWQAGYSLRISIIHNNNQPVALLPLYFNNNHGKWMILATGEAEESEISTEYADFIISEDQANQDPVDQVILSELKHLAKNGFEFSNCLASSHVYRFANFFKNSIYRTNGNRFELDLNVTFEDLMQSFSKNHRKKTREILNRYKANQGITFTQLSEKMFTQNWDTLRELHTLDWQRRGKTGAFSTPFFSAFHHYMHEKYPEVKQLFALIKFNDTPIAVNHYYRFRDYFHFYQSGSDKQQFARLSPGILLHTLCIESLCENQQVYDFMMGPIGPTYKEKFCQRGEKLHNITIYGNGLGQFVKCRVTRLLRSCNKFLSIFKQVIPKETIKALRHE